MKRQGLIQLLITGALFCALLAGCGESARTKIVDNSSDRPTVEAEESERGEFQAEENASACLETDVLPAQNEEEALAGGVPENEAECGNGGGESVYDTQWLRDFETVKEKLAALPLRGDELKELAGTEDCPVPVYEIAVSNNYVGQYAAEPQMDFRLLLEAGEAAEVLVMQYTVEGGLILDYLNFDGDTLYRVEDVSRDGFFAGAVKYYEYIYESAWFDTEVDEGGNAWDILYGLYEGDMVVPVFQTRLSEQSAEICTGLPLAEEMTSEPE